MIMVFPAPVSPVTAVSPGPNTTSTSSMTPRPAILSSANTAQPRFSLFAVVPSCTGSGLAA